MNELVEASCLFLENWTSIHNYLGIKKINRKSGVDRQGF